MSSYVIVLALWMGLGVWGKQSRDELQMVLRWENEYQKYC